MNTPMMEEQIKNQINSIVDSVQNQPEVKETLIYLMNRIGATIIGVKPAEILTFLPGRGKITSRDWEFSKQFLLHNDNFSLREILKPNGTRQVFFYHARALQETLRKQATLKFLIQLGYPEKFKIDLYIDLLHNRLRSGDFPHEIGVFLGYPLKDVLGFMGYRSLELIKTKGWKVYGSEKLSDLKYDSFSEARDYVCKLLQNIVS